MDDSSSFHRITRSQRRENLDETFEAEESDNGHVSDSDDDEYFPENEVVASDNDDAGEVDEIAFDKDDEDEDEDEGEEDEIEATVSGSGMTAKMVLSELRHQRVNIKLEGVILCDRDVDLIETPTTFTIVYNKNCLNQ